MKKEKTVTEKEIIAIKKRKIIIPFFQEKNGDVSPLRVFVSVLFPIDIGGFFCCLFIINPTLVHAAILSTLSAFIGSLLWVYAKNKWAKAKFSQYKINSQGDIDQV